MLKNISVFKGNKKDIEDWPTVSPKGFMRWFEAKFNQIPEWYAHMAVVQLSVEKRYGEDHPVIDICYHRPETEEEIKEKVSGRKATEQQQKERDLEQLQELMAKHYGPDARIVNKWEEK